MNEHEDVGGECTVNNCHELLDKRMDDTGFDSVRVLRRWASRSRMCNLLLDIHAIWCGYGAAIRAVTRMDDRMQVR